MLPEGGNCPPGRGVSYTVGRQRLLVLAAVLLIVGAACGAGTTEPTRIDLGTPGIDEPSTTAPAATPGPPTDTSAAESPATSSTRDKPEGPDAPDFELALGGPGGTFSLSGEAKPVFMVFWAEW